MLRLRLNAPSRKRAAAVTSPRRDSELSPCIQGIAALLAMNILAEVESLAEQPWGCADHLHAAIEAMRLAFGDALQYNADPDVVPVPIERLVSGEHARLRRAQSLLKP